MELDDLKNTWDAVSNEVSQQQILNPEIINKMIKKKYYSTLKKIAYPEIAGSIICLASAVFLAFNFTKLNTVFLRGTGFTAILLLIILPAISILSLRYFNMPDANKTYADTLKKFALQKIRFNKFQKVNITLSYLFLVIVVILLPKLFGAKDIIVNKYFWIFAFSIGYIFLLFFSKWVFKNYNKTLNQAEELLKEIGNIK